MNTTNKITKLINIIDPFKIKCALCFKWFDSSKDKKRYFQQIKKFGDFERVCYRCYKYSIPYGY